MLWVSGQPPEQCAAPEEVFQDRCTACGLHSQVCVMLCCVVLCCVVIC